MTDLEDRLTAHFANRDRSVGMWRALVAVVIKVSRRGGERLKRWDLSPAQFDVLTQVGKQPGLSQQELAERMLVTKGNVSQLLAKLDKQGFVRREQAGVTHSLFLTNRGTSLLSEMLPDYDQFLAEQFAVLSQEEQEVLEKVLVKLGRNLS